MKIVADSASNVFSLDSVAFASVPLKIITAQAEYVDDEKLDVKTMVDQIKATKGRTGTSCPNIHDWLEAFGEEAQVFAVTITSNLSGSCAAAVQAKQAYEESHPGARVHVIDTLSAGPEMRLVVEKLQQWILEGKTFDQICLAETEYRKNTGLLFSLESLTNFARNGRVNPAMAKVAGVLGIRIVGTASEQGTLQQLHKCRGEKKALETLITELQQRGFVGGKACISHSFNEPAAQELKDRILARWPDSNVSIEQNGGLCCYYAEPGGLLIGFETE